MAVARHFKQALPSKEMQLSQTTGLDFFPALHMDQPDHYTFLGNCQPTPPLSQYFTLSEK